MGLPSMIKQIVIALMAAVCVALPAQARAQNKVPPAPASKGAPPAGAQPKILIENPVYDFGTAPEGTPVRHTFKIKNVGKGELVIGSVRTTCGCTAAAPTRHRLGPGEEAAIAVKLDTRFEKGHQARTITAYTNDPEHPEASMTIEGTVKQLAAATPAQVAFGKIRQGTEVTKQVLISDLSGRKGFTVGAVSNSNSAIKVTKKKRPDGKAGALLEVSLLKSMPVGQFDDTIKVATSRVPIQIDVFGIVTGDLSVNPAQISFGIVPRGSGAVRIIRLTNQSARAVKVLGVTSDNVAVSASAQPLTAGKEYKVTVELHRGTPDGQVRGELRIATDDPTQRTLEVPFYGIVGQFQL
jgi:Protein of unknown function (DUF1573)/Flagellar-associated PapD-like